jgi:unsaturated rhamnogalacturonyl hydrolase
VGIYRAQYPTQGSFMTFRTLVFTLLAALTVLHVMPLSAAEVVGIGLTASLTRLDAVVVEATVKSAPTVVLVGGLHGDDASVADVRKAVAAYEQRRNRPLRLLAVPLANPDAAFLVFPPTGIAYREHAESHALWRWLGSQAPDLVLIASEEDAGLAAALGSQTVADMGRIPAVRWVGTGADWVSKLGVIAPSDARAELERRRTRSPRQLAEELATHYGHDFDQPMYINAIALLARIRLGQIDDVRRLVEPYVDGSKDSLARPNGLVMAGHIVFTELARRTGDPRYVAAVRKVADLGFDSAGQMLEAMPYHDQYSDSVFMGTAIVAQAGALTGERRYFDMADRHLRFMQKLVLRPDGLYRHQPLTDAAWGRGNGFAALGLALTLSELPIDHPGYAHALQSYRQLMAALLPQQTRDGLWRNVVDYPGAYPELSGTAMIGFALQRGLARGWIDARAYRQAVEQAWLAINSRVSSGGSLIDVSESTTRLPSLQQYLQRAALLGNDPRGGAMAMLFATERMDHESGWAAITRCATVKSASARYSCMDAVLRDAGLLTAASEAKPVAVPKPTPVPKLIAEPKPAVSAPPAAMPPVASSDRIAATLARVQRTPDGRWQLSTTDNAIWQQTEHENVLPEPKAGQDITIRKGSLGSFRCELPTHVTFRCVRTR